ncbi:hypothetical protein P152DRAFT_453002 [Eremomyces bilateralis CBS 781.70]|uniref:Uncharacterized protein n=1 Tax=Eremomyces bilateralis CBS 781.70 TaxID=1392243 RepID=A0A6G1FRF8_9PEZI|nr:uncharacterized protein P152DRAFT_453002 [Eremomyces bilateralis CBS 781.70]KAF1808318.1 hypothetical protein P152DRAFT_453002 [Eremomyces bilateralis CBS 781.70]
MSEPPRIHDDDAQWDHPAPFQLDGHDPPKLARYTYIVHFFILDDDRLPGNSAHHGLFPFTALDARNGGAQFDWAALRRGTAQRGKSSAERDPQEWHGADTILASKKRLELVLIVPYGTKLQASSDRCPREGTVFQLDERKSFWKFFRKFDSLGPNPMSGCHGPMAMPQNQDHTRDLGSIRSAAPWGMGTLFCCPSPLLEADGAWRYAIIPRLNRTGLDEEQLKTIRDPVGLLVTTARGEGVTDDAAPRLR